jgi:hypothetical protein
LSAAAETLSSSPRAASQEIAATAAAEETGIAKQSRAT